MTTSRKCANIFVLNFAHLFRRKLCKSVLLCAVFNLKQPVEYQGHKSEVKVTLFFCVFVIIINLFE